MMNTVLRQNDEIAIIDRCTEEFDEWTVVRLGHHERYPRVATGETLNSWGHAIAYVSTLKRAEEIYMQHCS